MTRCKNTMDIRNRILIGLVAATLLTVVLPQTRAFSVVAGEYEVKAAFLYNFAQFVEWPPDAFTSSKAPIVIGIFGQDPFGSALDEVVKNKTADGRRFVVKRFGKLRDVENCQILFVSASEESQLEKAAHAAGGKGVLTVGDSAHFITCGGIIRFIIENNKIGLEISVDHARNAGLKISSKLLRLARMA